MKLRVFNPSGRDKSRWIILKIQQSVQSQKNRATLKSVHGSMEKRGTALSPISPSSSDPPQTCINCALAGAVGDYTICSLYAQYVEYPEYTTCQNYSKSLTMLETLFKQIQIEAMCGEKSSKRANLLGSTTRCKS